MPRTTTTAVQAILGSNYDTVNTPDLTQFIEIANPLVTRVATCATAKDKTLTTEELEVMERLLAAHYYQCMDEGYTSRSTSKASGSFKGQFGQGLDRTTYGQAAKEMDYSGCLVALTTGANASGDWLGKTDSEALTYDERN